MIHYIEPYISQQAYRYIFYFLKNYEKKRTSRSCFLLENYFKKWLGVQHAFTCHSGTLGLCISLFALDIKESDEVITNPLTHISTISSVLNAKAKPILAKVKKNGFLDLKDVEKKINKNTRGIIAVHLNGFSEDMEALLRLKRKYNLYLIEDACQALGAKIKQNGEWKYLGTIGDIGIFSFGFEKTFTTFGGGMIVTNSDKLAYRIKRLINQGEYSTQEIILGYTCQLDPLRSSIGLANLEEIENQMIIRKKNWDAYKKALTKFNWLKIITSPKNAETNYSLMLVYIKNKSFTYKLIDYFKEVGYKMPETHIPNNYVQFTEILPLVYQRMQYFRDHIIILPVHSNLRQENINSIIDCFQRANEFVCKK